MLAVKEERIHARLAKKFACRREIWSVLLAHSGQKKVCNCNMRLDAENDLAIRSLLAMAVLEKRLSIAEIAKIFDMPRHTLARCFASLRSMGLITTQRGTGGGTELKVPAHNITLADIVMAIEPYHALAPCMENQNCRLLPGCMYRRKLLDALSAFHNELGKTTIRDLAEDPGTRGPIVTAARNLGYVDASFT